jgi:hypothetical protein
VRPSGSGWTQALSGSADPSAASADVRAGPRSMGSARFLRPFSMSKQTLVAMRYSHDRSCDRPSNRSYARHARIIVSCTASSASAGEPSIR